MHVTVSVKLSNIKYGEYSYSINENQFEHLQKGSQVIVNLNNRLKVGTVKDKQRLTDFDFKLKPIVAIYREKVLNQYQSVLANEIYMNSICSLYDIQNLFTTSVSDNRIIVKYYKDKQYLGEFSQLKNDPNLDQYQSVCETVYNDELKTYQYIKVANEKSALTLTPKQQCVYDYLAYAGSQSITKVIEQTGISRGVINTMIKNQVLDTEHLSKQFETLFELDWHQENKLSPEQKFAFDSLTTGQNLLYGVSSSGKTEVYIEAIKKQVALGAQSLIIVPSVMLAVQVVGRLQKVFGQQVLIYHHKLSEGEKLSYRNQIENNLKTVIISTFEGLFLPFINLKYVILDEAHSPNYRVGKNINVNKQVLIDGLLKQQIDVVLGTATPLISDYAMAEYNNVNLVTINNRFGVSEFPEVRFVKTQNEIISDDLKQLILINKQRKKPTIIFFNKSGYSSQVLCLDCYHLHACPNCHKPLSYSRRANRLVCKYDGYSQLFTGHCQKCKSKNLKYIGIGIEQFTSSIKNLYPDLTVGFVDGKTKTDELYQVMSDFGAGTIDILIGTQTIAYGIDFLNVDNIYVVNIDNLLTMNEVNNHEKTYNILEQVIGRVGRNSKFSNAIIETNFEHHFVMKAIANHKFYNYYQQEMSLRKNTNTQPFYRICKVELNAANPVKLENVMSRYQQILNTAGLNCGPIQTPYIENRFGNHRRYFLIKYRHQNIRDILRKNMQFLIQNNIDYNIDLNNNEIGV